MKSLVLKDLFNIGHNAMARPKKEKSLHRGKRVYIRFTELEYELVAGYTL